MLKAVTMVKIESCTDDEHCSQNSSQILLNFSDEEINSGTLNSDTVVGNKKTRQIFDKEEEVLLEAYIKAASDIYIELTLYDVRKLAFGYGICLKKKASPRSG